jgi:LacI family transcriptional regulator
MAGQTPPEETTFVPPRRIVARRSTELWAIDDEPASRAYQFIRDSVDSGINVDDVARTAGLSRRVLERRMQQYFDKTPHELIAQFRIRRLRQLLEDTELPLNEIASLAGFAYVEHMSLFFKQHEGIPPGRYRTQQRGVRR